MEKVFEFSSRPENLQLITPPWLDFRIVDSPKQLQPGSLIRYRLRWRWVPLSWKTEITDWDPPNRFIDTQLSGPYILWRHQHWFEPERGGTRARDQVDYILPFGPVGRLTHWAFVRKDLDRIFDYRCEQMRTRFGGAP